MGISHRLIRNAGLVMFAGIATKIFAFIFVAYAARVLGPYEFGVYALIGTIAFLFHFLSNLGVGPMALREMARDKSKIEELFSHVLTIRLVLVVIFYPVLIGAIHLIGYSSEIKFLVYVTGLTAIVSTLSDSFSIIYMAREQFIIPSMVTVSVAFLNSVANIIVLYLGFGLKGMVIVTFLCALIGMVISGSWIWMRVLKFRLSFNAAAWKDLVLQSTPFAILTFMGQAGTHMNTLFLSKLPGAGPLALGYYNPAISLCRQAMVLPASFRQAALPAVSSNAGNLRVIEGIIVKSTKVLVVLVSVPLILVSSFFPREIISLVFGVQYLPSVPAFVIFGWAFALRIYNVPVTVTLTASRDINKFIPWRLLIFSINIILIVPLIIFYSFVGAAIAFLITEIFETILRHHLLKVIWDLKLDTLASILRLAIPIAVLYLALLVAYFSSVGLVTLILLMAVLYTIYFYYNNGFRMLTRYMSGLGRR